MERGRANRELLHFLAEAFGAAKQNIGLIRGESGRAKIVQIHSPAQIPAEIRALAPKIREAQAQ